MYYLSQLIFVTLILCFIFFINSKYYYKISGNKKNQILFLVPPRWIIEPTDKAFAQGSDAKIECKADGFPRPQVTWKKASGGYNFSNFCIKKFS